MARTALSATLILTNQVYFYAILPGETEAQLIAPGNLPHVHTLLWEAPHFVFTAVAVDRMPMLPFKNTLFALCSSHATLPG